MPGMNRLNPVATDPSSLAPMFVLVVGLLAIGLAACKFEAADSPEGNFWVRAPEDLSPPLVENPIFPCAQKIWVSGFAPGSHVQVFKTVGGIQIPVGEATPTQGFAEIDLTASLELGAKISATQTFATFTSAPTTNPTEVTEPPSPPLEWRAAYSQLQCSSDPRGFYSPVSSTSDFSIVEPVCDTDEFVRVRGAVMASHLILLKKFDTYNAYESPAIGYGGGNHGETLLARGEDFEAGDILTVFQWQNGSGVTDENQSTESVIVYACSEEWIDDRVAEILFNASTEHLPKPFLPSTTPLFADHDDSHSFVHVTIRANFTKVNEEPDEDDAESDGTVTIFDPDSNFQPMEWEVEVEARGNNRFLHCGWRPLHLQFTPSETVGTLLDGAVSSGAGRLEKLQVVTHCGSANRPQSWWAGTPTLYERRVLQEFALFQVLEATGLAGLETRLAFITYEDLSGNVLEAQYGFFRERKDHAAMRGGFIEIDPGTLPPHEVGRFRVQLHERFLFAQDYDLLVGHNVVPMQLAGGGVWSYYLPYDFDFSGIIRPDVPTAERSALIAPQNETLEQNGIDLLAWLEAEPDQDLALVQVAALLENRDAMREVLEESLADDPGKAALLEWFDDHIRRLVCFINPDWGTETQGGS